MDGANVFLLGGISFFMITLLLLSATLYYYITIKKFNKYGIVTYGEIESITEGFRTRYIEDSAQQHDHLWIKFNIEGQEKHAYIDIPILSQIQQAKKFAIGSKKKIKVLKNKKGIYEARLLKEKQENVNYQKPIVLAIITALTLSVSVWFLLSYSSCKKDIINSSNNNKALNNPYIEKFATLNDETIESMNIKFDVQGRVENPNISQANYVWEIKDDMKIKGTINSEGKVRSVELEAQDSEFYDNNVKFASDISTLNGKTKITYEEVKAKCGGIDGIPTRISNGKVNTYVWVNAEYKLTITIGSSGYVTSTTLKSR